MNVSFVPPRPCQWCGKIESWDQATVRLLAFTRNTSWRYMNYTEMLFGIYCNKNFELCEEEFQVQ